MEKWFYIVVKELTRSDRYSQIRRPTYYLTITFKPTARSPIFLNVVFRLKIVAPAALVEQPNSLRLRSRVMFRKSASIGVVFAAAA